MNTSTVYETVRSQKETKIKTKTLLPFLALSFGLTWGLAAMFLLFTDQLTTIFGEASLSNPLVILAVYSPGIAGVLLVLWHSGLKGLGSFLRRLTLWRAPVLWWLFLLLGIPAVVYTGAAIKGSLGDPFPFSAWYQALPALATALVLGPIEEFGWRVTHAGVIRVLMHLLQNISLEAAFSVDFPYSAYTVLDTSNGEFGAVQCV